MAWVIASTPFWASAVFWIYGAFAAYLNRRPGETDRVLAEQFFIGAGLAAICLFTAAWMCS